MHLSLDMVGQSIKNGLSKGYSSINLWRSRRFFVISRHEKTMALTLYIPMKRYLAEWLVHKHGGQKPIKIGKCSPEALVLERHLRTPPRYAGYVPQVAPSEEEVAIDVPLFRYRDPRTYSYLPARGVKAFRECVRVSFSVELWRDIYTTGNVTKRNDLTIQEWMRSHGITYNDTNYNTIKKILQRLRVANNGGERLSDRKTSHHRKKC